MKNNLNPQVYVVLAKCLRTNCFQVNVHVITDLSRMTSYLLNVSTVRVNIERAQRNQRLLGRRQTNGRIFDSNKSNEIN